MGTNMAVNYANIFMSKFEKDLLHSYREIHGTQPELWLRFIDDIFFIWTGDLEQLQHFINYCNTFSEKQGYKSNIKFTSHFSTESVDFLDVKISIAEKQIKTELFSKPTAAHLYVHRASDHPHHVIKAIPKSQFLRIRRICSEVNDYEKHANQFIKFFIKRGYNPERLRRTKEEIKKLDRNSLFQTKSRTDEQQNRIPLVLNWNQKFSNIPRVLRQTYDQIVKTFPNFQTTFPNPPFVSFRKNRNFKQILCSHPTQEQNRVSQRCTPEGIRKKGAKCKLCPNMSQTDKIKNNKSGITKLGHGGDCHSTNLVYAAECTKCQLIYIGCTTNQLNTRFNGHRHDAKHKPEATELAHHFFNSSDCNIEDVKVTILEKIDNATLAQLERREDYWIATLQTQRPYGLNQRANTELLPIHQAIFN